MSLVSERKPEGLFQYFQEQKKNAVYECNSDIINSFTRFSDIYHGTVVVKTRESSYNLNMGGAVDWKVTR